MQGQAALDQRLSPYRHRRGQRADGDALDAQVGRRGQFAIGALPIQKQRAHHVARDGVDHQAQELPHLDRAGLAQRMPRAEQHAVDDGLVRGVVAKVGLAHAMLACEGPHGLAPVRGHVGLGQVGELGGRIAGFAL